MGQKDPGKDKRENNCFALQSNSRFKKDITAHLVRYEEPRNRIYLDSKGIPTIGIGIALGYIKDGKVILYSRDEINKILASGNSTVRISGRDHQMLASAIDTVNKKKLNEQQKRDLLKPISLTLTDAQVKQNFEAQLKKRSIQLETHANEYGIDLVKNTPHEVNTMSLFAY